MIEGKTLSSKGLGQDVADLIWTTFFSEAQRGVRLELHFPWLFDADTWIVALRERGTAVAAAAIRPSSLSKICMIGCVCVARQLRGRGLGKRLMDACHETVISLGFRHAMLWSGKPSFYKKLGYEAVFSDRFVTLSLPPVATTATREWLIRDLDPREVGFGVPSFATRLVGISWPGASAIAACGDRGLTVLDFEGEWPEVANLLATSGHEKLAMNLPEGSGLLERLRANGSVVTDETGAATMLWPGARPLELQYIPMPHRI